ncbi:Survival factor 1 [Debaryomyces fabryi]|uniref:Survival factor 1 n=1 Tax=Debaryomyces fabryi TaxID=58627 RepID=A0A0V1PY34_9ASCO|nr:Survival factor 1 [Debaryomyces fabryi]KSA00981.1 Survival factor 1 [Debaryomyces fabryi]CUM49737.1 unnamed protein product [Debaryomyces fabryi]
MLKWVQSGLSAVAGTAEPEYGREAIHPITDTVNNESKCYRETTIEDFGWIQPTSTNVETQTFYFSCLKTGYLGFAQVIHSNVMGVHTTAQFTFRLFNFKGKEEDNLWTSTKLEDFRCEGSNFYANELSIELDKDNTLYRLKSSVNKDSVVDLTVVKLVPGVIFGENGTTYYGDDLANPWGSMRHLFWPRCSVTGTVKSGDKVFEIEGFTMFVMAMQGMKPHHAAKAWNFLNFQSESHSAVQMEFTTPRSYANTKVNIAILTSNDKILSCSVNNEIVHENAEVDEVGWPVPKSITFNFEGVSDDNKKVVGKVHGALKTLVERVDVMAEIPQFIKNIASGVAGTRPYIYQFCNDMEIEIDGTKESGVSYSEATFISE